MKCSVVIGTYNGEKFIFEQLKSIREQSRQADEVIICDDGSKDRTVEIIKKFIEDNRCVNWMVKQNDTNKGWKRNFHEMIKAASNEIIFYCDQDDLWTLDHISSMITVFEKNKDVACLSCRYIPIDENGNEIKANTDKTSNNTYKISELTFADKRYYVPLGCTLAFRKDICEYIDGSMYDISPDNLISWLSSYLKKFYDIDAVLLLHRFHSANETRGIDEINSRNGAYTINDRIFFIKGTLCVLNTIKEISRKNKLSYDCRLKNDLSFEEARLDLLKNKRIKSFIKLIKRLRLNNRFMLFMGDIFYLLGIQRFIGKVYNYLALKR